MKNKLINYLEKIGVPLKEKPVLLAVSGGRDSMVMAHLFLKANIPIEIAHFNFQLRGDESLLDESFVREFAQKNKVVCHVKKEDTSRYSEEKKVGIQEAARELRYHWFNTILRKRKLNYVATAHHKDDAAETMIFNFIRGGSIEALKGISSKRKNIIRPLMFASQDEIIDYAEKNQIEFREDKSNSSTKYSRNRIRHNVIPELKKINPSLVETMSRSAKIYQQGAWIIDQVIEKELSSILIREGNNQKLEIQHLIDSKYQNLLLWKWIQPLGFSSKHTHEILALLDSRSGKKTRSTAYEIVRDRDFLLAHPISTTTFSAHTFSSLDALMSYPSFESKLIDAQHAEFNNDKQTAFFDCRKISFPAELRPWKKGDHFSPLGMKGKNQKVSDLLIQEKISVVDKPSVMILTFENEIAWVIGLRVSEKFKIDSNSEDVLMVKYLNPHN